MNRQAVLSLSGGMDSSTLLLHLLAAGYQVTALSFDYGQKHKIELERAKELVNYLNFFENGREQGNNVPNYFPVTHQIIKLDGLSQLLNSNLVEGGDEVPEGHYEQENMKDTVVPNRNKIFSSIIQAVALSLANTPQTTKGKFKVGSKVVIGMGIHAGDHAIYPDCRQEFRDADFEAFKVGNWNSEMVEVYTPYLDVDKHWILKDGEECCNLLGLDFNEVYKRTMTSYKPIYIETNPGFKAFINPKTKKQEWTLPKGDWYSDYKSASSVERIEAFIELGRPDPAKYADKNGPVTWETIKSHVEKVLENA